MLAVIKATDVPTVLFVVFIGDKWLWGITALGLILAYASKSNMVREVFYRKM
ncbi:MAG: hypothetical protein WKF84_29465 [Pyrinomonadaceae bacterium]